MNKTIKKIKKIGVKNWIVGTKNPKFKIKKLMKKYSTAYYEGRALISDLDFDVLIDCLRQIDSEDDYLKKSGWGYSLKKGVNHKYGKIGTLPYLYDYDKLKSIFINETDIVIMPKYDGINCVAYYENGVVKKFVTRGNGYLGKDITKKIDTKNLNDLVNAGNLNFAVSGEVVCLFSRNANQSRNDVAKILNSKLVSKKSLHKLKFKPFGLLNYENDNYVNEIKVLQELVDDDIVYLQFNKLPSKAEIISIYKKFQKNYAIDGLVITNKLKTKQVAFKFKEGQC